jgi:hypothetical protein
MSVIQRGLRSSTRSKAVIGRVRDAMPDDPPRAIPLRSAAGLDIFSPRRAGASAPLAAASMAAATAPPAKPLTPSPPPVVPVSLSDDQHAAAEQLAEIFAEAEFEVWARGGPSHESARTDPLEPSAAALIARSAYREAMRAVPVLLSPLVVHVCCLGLPLALWAAEKRLPLLQAEAGLRSALNHLVRHFRGSA